MTALFQRSLAVSSHTISLRSSERSVLSVQWLNRVVTSYIFEQWKKDMNIQPMSIYGISAYESANKVSARQAVGASNTPSMTSPGTPAGSNVSLDTVTISPAARDLAASQDFPTQSRTSAQEKLLNAAASDSQTADKLASDMANTKSQIFYDLRGLKGGDIPNRLSPPSGRIVNDAYKQSFSNEALIIDNQRLSLYNSEKAKGTDSVQILRKMIDFTNMQSQDYLDGSGWAE